MQKCPNESKVQKNDKKVFKNLFESSEFCPLPEPFFGSVENSELLGFSPKLPRF